MILLIDNVAPSIQLTFDGFSSKKSILGGVTTIFISILSLYAILYFGLDIIYRKNPITRFSKKFANTTYVNLNDFPVSFIIVDRNANPIKNVEKYIKFNVNFYEIRYNTETKSSGNVIGQMYIEKCAEEYFNSFKDLFYAPGSQLPLDMMFCLNTHKIKYPNYTEQNANLTIMNQRGSIPGNFLSVELWPCTNNTGNQICAPQSEIDQVIKDFYIVYKLPNYYVDLNDYQEPYKAYIYSYTTPMSYGLTQSLLINLKKSHLFTDSGFLLQENSNSSYPLIDYIRGEITVKESLIGFFSIVMSQQIEENNYRHYIKIQDIIANVGGLIKSLFLIGSFLTSFVTDKIFIFDISNQLLVDDVQNTNEELQKSTSNMINNHFLMRRNKMTVIQSRSKQNKFVPSGYKFLDYLKSRCGMKSRYKKAQYVLIENFIENQLSVTHLINQTKKIERLIDILSCSQEEFRNSLNYKINSSELEALNKAIFNEDKKILSLDMFENIKNKFANLIKVNEINE